MIISVFDRVENIVGKGENAGYQHFLFLPQCFEKDSLQDSSKGVIVWEWVNQDCKNLAFSLRCYLLHSLVNGKLRSSVRSQLFPSLL